MESIENLMDLYGPPWISMDIHGYPWTSMDLHGPPWISMDIHGLPRIFYDFHRCSRIFVDFRRFSSRCAKWLKIAKNNFSRFLAFYPLISAFQALSCLANDRSRRDLSFGIENSSFHAIWLGIEPFLCFFYRF